jgi:hypothetical protein
MFRWSFNDSGKRTSSHERIVNVINGRLLTEKVNVSASEQLIKDVKISLTIQLLRDSTL